MDQDYVLGTDDSEKKIMHVKKDSKHKFIFENAREVLGVQDRYKEMEALEAKNKVLKDAFKAKQTDGYKLANGVQMRYSTEIGGNKNTTHEIIEWPSDEFLGNLTQE
jgi:hypothetical protein